MRTERERVGAMRSVVTGVSISSPFTPAPKKTMGKGIYDSRTGMSSFVSAFTYRQPGDTSISTSPENLAL